MAKRFPRTESEIAALALLVTQGSGTCAPRRLPSHPHDLKPSQPPSSAVISSYAMPRSPRRTRYPTTTLRGHGGSASSASRKSAGMLSRHSAGSQQVWHTRLKARKPRSSTSGLR